MSLAGRSARRRDAREHRTHQTMKASSNARQRNRRGAAPKHRGGKHHKGGNRPHRGTPPANTPPTASPLQEEGRGARLAEVGDDPRTSA